MQEGTGLTGEKWSTVQEGTGLTEGKWTTVQKGTGLTGGKMEYNARGDRSDKMKYGIKNLLRNAIILYIKGQS